MDDGVGLLATCAAIASSLGALVRACRVRRVHAAGIPLLLVGWVGLVVAVLPRSLHEHVLPLVAALSVALVAGWVAARWLAGAERWLLAAGALVLTVRIPVPTGGDDTAMLLAPLYAVLAVGALVLARHEWRALAGADRLLPHRGGATRMLDVAAALLPAAATASLAWSWDVDATTETLAFYLAPFVLVYALVRAWLAAGVDVRPAAAALVAGGVAYAAVGLVQAATQQVWWNPKVVDANRFRPDFRTNSLFWDPNMYGRALVVTLLALVAWMLVSRARRSRLTYAVVTCGVLALALWHSYSQSSWVALSAALVVLAVLTLPPRARRWVAAATAALLLAGMPLAADRLAGDDAEGRAAVVRTGLALTSERPLVGWGMGAFESAAIAREREQGNRDPRLVASHTTPVTVLAELGILGAFTYLTLLTSAAVAVLARWRRTSTPASRARADGHDPAATGWPSGPVIWAGATLVALFTHSLLYAGFFEDPTLWAALAVVASLPVARVATIEPERLAEPDAPRRTEGVTAHTG